MATRLLAIVISVLVISVAGSALLVAEDVLHPALPDKVTVEFTESGLQGGQKWGVTILENVTASGTSDGTVTEFTTNQTLYVTIPNANSNYSLILVPNGYMVKEKTGQIYRSGASFQHVNVTFEKLYNVTFDQSGLPPSSTWLVVVYATDSGVIYEPPDLPPAYADNSTQNSSLTLQLPNGSFSYRLEYQTLNETYFPVYSSTVNVLGNALLNVSGKSLTEPVVMTNVSHQLTVQETGFPKESGWYFNIYGENEVSYWMGGNSPYGVMEFSLPDGTYQYQAKLASGCNSSNAIGEITIAGNVSLMIKYVT